MNTEINLPDAIELDNAIDSIVTAGLVQPQSLWSYLAELRRCLGLKIIFMDAAQAVILTATAICGVLLAFPIIASERVYTALFALSPMLFSMFVLFTETIEQYNGLYELKMTCKYTIRQIAAFRTLCFSLAGMVFCTFLSAFCNWYMGIGDLLRLMSISLGALFLCASMTMFLMRRFRDRRVFAVATGAWLMLNCLLMVLFGAIWERMITEMPTAITVVAALISGGLFAWETTTLLLSSRKEGYEYAIS